MPVCNLQICIHKMLSQPGKEPTSYNETSENISPHLKPYFHRSGYMTWLIIHLMPLSHLAMINQQSLAVIARSEKHIHAKIPSHVLEHPKMFVPQCLIEFTPKCSTQSFRIAAHANERLNVLNMTVTDIVSIKDTSLPDNPPHVLKHPKTLCSHSLVMYLTEVMSTTGQRIRFLSESTWRCPFGNL